MMPANPEPEPLEKLRKLLDEEQKSAEVWRANLAHLRSRASATSAVLNELASTPVRATPLRRSHVDVVLAAPDEDWAKGITEALRTSLGSDAKVLTDSPGIPLADSVPAPGYTVRCEVRLDGVGDAEARDRVRAALDAIDADVDYSEPIDLFVVAPGASNHASS